MCVCVAVATEYAVTQAKMSFRNISMFIMSNGILMVRKRIGQQKTPNWTPEQSYTTFMHDGARSLFCLYEIVPSHHTALKCILNLTVWRHRSEAVKAS